jgi:hypothetical protein
MYPTKFQFIWQSSFRGEDFLEINQSETRIVYGAKLGREHPWKVLCKDCSFHPDPLTNMAVTGDSCF